MSDQTGRAIATLSTISTGLLAWIGYMATDQRDALEASVKTSQLAINQQSEERQRLNGQRDLNLKVYDAVVSAIQDSSQRRQEIARSLVYAMIADTALQQGFLQALRQEGVPAVRQRLMQEVARNLTSTGLAPAQARVRSLPASVNERPGYYAWGYQIRFEAGEQDDAEKLRKAMLQAIPAASQTTVTLVPVSSPTPGYISAFACP
jgi:hypothetical protein